MNEEWTVDAAASVVIMNLEVPRYRGMVSVLVNIDVTWVNVQGHLNKPFFFFVLAFEVIHPYLGLDGRMDCYATPPHSYENDTSPLDLIM